MMSWTAAIAAFLDGLDELDCHAMALPLAVQSLQFVQFVQSVQFLSSFCHFLEYSW